MEEKHLLNAVCKVIKSKIYKQTNKNQPIKEQETLSSKITNYLNRYQNEKYEQLANNKNRKSSFMSTFREI